MQARGFSIISLLKKIPVEFLFFIPLLCVWLVVFVALRTIGFSDTISDVNYRGILNGALFSFLLLCPFLFAHPALRFLEQKTQTGGWVQWLLYRVYQSVLYVLFVYFLLTAFSLFVIVVFASTNVEYTTAVSLFHARMDTVLGVPQLIQWLVTFFENHASYLYTLVNVSYNYTVTAVVVAPFLLALKSAKLAREYAFGIVMMSVLMAPLWMLVPALAPLQLTLSDSVSDYSNQTKLFEETQVYRDLYQVNQESTWGENVLFRFHYWEQTYASGFGLPVSCNPSMHVGWGLLLLIFTWRANRTIALFVFVFLVAESVGTFFFLQHYIVDVLTGVLVALLVPMLTSRLLSFEATHLHVKTHYWFMPLQLIESIGKRISALGKHK